MPLWKRKGSPYWQGYARAGKRRSRPQTTGCRDKAAASAVLREWERELADPAYRTSKGVTFDAAAESLMRQYRQLRDVGKKAAATVSFYEEKIRSLRDGLSVVGLVEIDAVAVDAFVSKRRGEHASEHTIHKELGALWLLLRHAKRAGWWTGDVDALKPRDVGKVYQPRQRHLASLRELGRLLRAIPSADVAAQVAFAVATGAEAQAITRARPEDLQEGFVALHGKKRPSRERVVPIVASWQETLLRFARRWVRGHGLQQMQDLDGDGLGAGAVSGLPAELDAQLAANDRADAPATGRPPPRQASAARPRRPPERVALFAHPGGLRKALRLACSALQIPHLSPNDLRRTFRSWLRRDGVPNELVAAAMGHASSKLLDANVYGRITPEVLRDRMASAVQSARTVSDHGSESGRTEADGADGNVSKLAPRAGFEPATHGLTVRSLTAVVQRGKFNLSPTIVNLV